MSETALIDRADESDRADAATAGVAPASRAERRAAARQAFTRRALAVTAGAGVAATALAFVALSRPAAAPKAQLQLPSAKAANAAFVQGLLAAKPATTAKQAAVVPAAVPAGSTPVMIENYAFSPATLTIATGTKVTWTNMDTAPHTVTVDSGPVKFSSPTLQKGDTFTYTFTAPGTYTYYCAVHPDMTAKVIVTGSTSSATPTATPTTATPTPTDTMPMPTTEASCAISSALQTFLTHVNSAHLDESPGQQVQDILDIDSYVGNHLVLFQKMLEPATGGGLTSALSTSLQALFTHINAGHLGESPGQQAQDILDFNQYIATHLALFQKMASGWEALAC
jgi:plastocyanin